MTKDELTAFYTDQVNSQEGWFKYKGETYFIQGYLDLDTNKLCIDLVNLTTNKRVWIHELDKPTSVQETNAKAFMEAPIFEGKTFMEIYPDVKWLYYDDDDDDNTDDKKESEPNNG